jgi:hypothetical protein
MNSRTRRTNRGSEDLVFYKLSSSISQADWAVTGQWRQGKPARGLAQQQNTSVGCSREKGSGTHSSARLKSPWRAEKLRE